MKMQSLRLLFAASGMLVLASAFIVPLSKNESKTPSLPAAHSVLLGDGVDVEPGEYKIRAANTTSKYLDVDHGVNGEFIRINGVGSTVNDVTWIIKKVEGPLGGCTIQSKRFKTKFMDANFFHTDENGCKVQLWNRTGPNGQFLPPNGSLISTNQEWYVDAVSITDRKYRIRNVKSPTMYLDADNEGVEGTAVKLREKVGKEKSQMWIFEKVN